MSKLAFTLTLASAAFISGCQSVQYYDGPERRKSETAEVFVSTFELLPVNIYSINGKIEDFRYSKRLYLVPGEYSIELRTGPYNKVGESSGPTYQGRFLLAFTAKPGKTYTFQSQAAQARMNANSKLCVFEEEQDSPTAKANWTNEFRSPSPEAMRLTCSIVDIH
jgi:hypothetical protein